VGVAANLAFDGDGNVQTACITLGGVAGAVVIATEAAQQLIGKRPSAEDLAAAAEAAASVCDPTDDQRGSAAYKTAMVRVWTRRTLERCLAHHAG
jgi:carbon-monoxide dehydrogenase medium subunit